MKRPKMSLQILLHYVDTLKIIPASIKVWNFLEGYRVITIGSFLAFFLGYLGTWAPPGSFIFLCVLISWVTVTKHAEFKKQEIIKSRQLIAQNEMAEIERRLKDLPSWVRFPEEEQAEWLNSILKKFWPFVNRYVQDFLRKQVEPQIKEQLPPILNSGFKFGSINLGKQAPRVGSIKSFLADRETDRGWTQEIVADVDLIYPGDCNLQLIFSKVPTAGVQDLKVSGKLRVVMSPLLDYPPFVGALTFYFKEPPTLDFDLTNAANVFDLPGVNTSLRGMIRDQIDSRLTLPNRMVVPMCKTSDVDLVDLQHPIPEGVIRIAFLEAKDLMSLDITGKSDPYALVQVGATTFRTKTVTRELHPVWNEFFEAPVFFAETQTIRIHLYDANRSHYDEKMGNTVVGIKQFTQAPNSVLDKWLTLTDAESGKVHMMGSWLSLSDNPNDLKTAFDAHTMLPPGSNNLAVAYLKVAVLGAKSLPRNKNSQNSLKDDRPSPLVQVSLVGQKVSKKDKSSITPSVADTCDPTWNSGFHFFLPNPSSDKVLFEVLDEEKSRKVIGSVHLNVVDLLKEPQMSSTLTLTLNADRKYGFYSRSTPTLKVRATLRLLVPENEEQKRSRKYSHKNSVRNINAQYKDETGSSSKSHRSATLNERSTSKENNDVEINGGLIKQVSLSAISGKPESSSDVAQINLSFAFVEARKRLTVTVNEAKNLWSIFKNIPSCYVTIHVTSSTNQEQVQTTETIARSENPNWCKALNFNMSADLLEKSTISLVLSDHADQTVNGYAKIRLKTIDIRMCSYWFPLNTSEKFVEPLPTTK